MLRQVGGFSLAPQNGNAAALPVELMRTRPDIALLELSGDLTFTILSEIRHTTPCPLVLWVDSISPELAFQAIALGIRGILRKTLSPKLQVECLRKVLAGEVWFEKTLLGTFTSPQPVALTGRENEILSLLSQGLKNREIATHLAVSEGTVKVYLTKLFQKIGAKDRFELALFGLKNFRRQPAVAADDIQTAELQSQACALT